MELYPGMQAHMGRWNFYIVKMTMREVAEGVKFASDVYDNKTLDEALQRTLDESRVKKEIVAYLQRQPDRFFNSIVVAAIGGAPNWFPVTIEDDPQFSLFKGDRRLNSTFGILTFDGSQNYYALDGQHRLSGIKALVDPKSDATRDAPKGFDQEEISVLIVVPGEDDLDEGEFRERYRRLFGNLNRYAKPMDQVTNIIMDEDDAFAIITRRLISDHQFFSSVGDSKNSHRIKTTKGKNLTRQDPYFTSLETLYEMNIALLDSRARKNAGWGADSDELKTYKRFRPGDDEVELLAGELGTIWDALLAVLPVLNAEPVLMRNHDVISEPDSGDERDNLLFWPIGQQMMAEAARDLLDYRLLEGEELTERDAADALKPLGEVTWDLGGAPWKNLLVIPAEGDGKWRIRNEERKQAVNVGLAVLRAKLGIDSLDDAGVAALRGSWESLLLPQLDPAEIDRMWSEVGIESSP